MEPTEIYISAKEAREMEWADLLKRLEVVATDAQVIQFHRHHRDPEDQPVAGARFFAWTDSARVAQGQCARG
jgi:hypothetical protein